MALVSNQIVQAKVETTPGTWDSPAAGDAILCSNVSVSATSARMYDRSVIKGTLGSLQQIYAGSLMQVTFDLEIKGSGTAGTAPEADAVFQMAGFGVTTVALTSVTYAPISTGFETCSVAVDVDGKLYKIKGCVADLSFTMNTGEVAMANVTVTGRLESLTDGSVTSSYDATVPAALIGVPFSIGGYGAVINALSIGLNNTIALPPSISDAEGYGQPRITKRSIEGSFDPEQELVATESFDADWRSGAVKLLTTGDIGGTAGNKTKFTCSYVHYRDVTTGDREGILTHDIPFGAAESAGDDDISIAFT